MKHDLNHCLSANSINSYRRYWHTFSDFITSHFNLNPYRSKAKHIEIFVAHLHHDLNYSVSTIRCYLSAIAFKFKLKTNVDPTKSFALAYLLKSYSKISSPAYVRKPINCKLMMKLQSHLSVTKLSDYYKSLYFILYYIMYHAAYFAFFINKIEEITQGVNCAIAFL